MQIDATVKLSKNFTLAELTTVGRHTAYGPETLAWGYCNIDKLTQIAVNLLQPIRDHVGGPVVITSCARTWGLNMAIAGSSSTTQHTRCEAADIVIPSMASEADALSVVTWIAVHSGIAFGQLIHEVRNENGISKVWTHISLGAPWRPAGKCREVLRCTDGTYSMLEL